jgi:hypothetical protein
MSRYRKIFVKMWADKKFRGLSAPGPNGQTLWIFLLTGPLTSRIPGLFSAGEAGFAEIIGWPLEGFQKAFKEISQKGMAKVDWEARLIWIPKAIFYNQPENPNVIKGWKDTWDEMPECNLKLQVFQEIDSFMKRLGEVFVKAFHEVCVNPLPNPFGNPSGNPFGNPSRNPLPNQEQEQEQEQEYYPPSEGEPDRLTEKNISQENFSGNIFSDELHKSQPVKIESTPTKTRLHPRLQIFAEEYRETKDRAYIVGNYQAEGGAAKRTCANIPDEGLYRRAVRAYLAHNEKRITENGHSFLWFIRDLNRWVTQAQGGTHAGEDSSKYDGIYE